ncbi:CPBP family intramembrane glutamic endopeptidase [Pseudokineococcus sp. 1T1Z-3]|uniref:CPBP family intramembrane glutamic endopeptidase n=1 Tax=Pseudokineococcus sp. 1T1Z-3 TaxID=3132745 RepID=UPI00309B9947
MTTTTSAPAGATPPVPTVTAAPVTYHRVAHLDPRSARWWRPVAVLGVAAGLLLALATAALAALLPVVVLEVVREDLGLAPLPAWVPLPSQGLDDPRNPVDLLLMLGTVALLLPVVVLALRWGGRQRGLVHSVEGRFRWAMALRAATVLLPAYAALLWGLAVVLPPADLSVPPLDGRLAVVLLVVLVLTPLQCAAEEYAFRGFPQQLLGTWLRRPVLGVLLPVPLFMAGHGYDWVGQVDIALFALAMGALVWKTGGLELAVVAHTANNLALLLAAPLSPSSLQQGEVDPWVLAVSLALTLLTTAGLWVWVSRTHGLRWSEPVRGTGRGGGRGPTG